MKYITWIVLLLLGCHHKSKKTLDFFAGNSPKKICCDTTIWRECLNQIDKRTYSKQILQTGIDSSEFVAFLEGYLVNSESKVLKFCWGENMVIVESNIADGKTIQYFEDIYIFKDGILQSVTAYPLTNQVSIIDYSLFFQIIIQYWDKKETIAILTPIDKDSVLTVYDIGDCEQ